MRTAASKTCETLSTPADIAYILGLLTVDKTPSFPLLLHYIPPIYSHVITTLLPVVPMQFSPVSTAPIITHHEIKNKKGI